jgi:hypothetical protein
MATQDLKQLNLTIDEQDLLNEIVQSYGWDTFLKVAEGFVRDIEANVLRYHLISGPEGLVHEKARAEGAQKLLLKLKELKKIAKNQGE